MNEHERLMSEYLKNFEQKIKKRDLILPVDSPYCAVIIEPRNVKNLEKIIFNHLYFLNEKSNIKWGLQIFHGKNNEDFIKNITHNIKNITYHKIDVDDFSKIEYNEYVKSYDFWSKVKGEKILMFQQDSLLLRHGIENFLEYDYIGAPWTKPKEGSFIGNGGLSLRTKDVMTELSKLNNEKEPSWEDIFFVKHLKRYNLPSIETAMKFSVEDVFYPNPIGIHNPIKITKQQLYHILQNSLINF